MGIRGSVPGFPELPKAPYDGPSVEPLVGLELLRAWADDVPEVLYVIRAVWPRVLTPDDGAPASSVEATAPPTDEVRSDRACVHGAADIVEGTPSSADLLSKDPSWALLSGHSSSPLMCAEATLDA
jgi:hypothetical protein